MTPDLDLRKSIMENCSHAVDSYVMRRDKRYQGLEGEARSALLDTTMTTYLAMQNAHVNMNVMHHLILQGRTRSWWEAERDLLARLTIAVAAQPRFFDGRGRVDPPHIKSLRKEAGSIKHLYPWFIATPIPDLSAILGPGPSRWSLLGDIKHQMAKAIAEDGANVAEHFETITALEEIMPETGLADADYAREVREILMVMEQEFHRWSEDPPRLFLPLIGQMLYGGLEDYAARLSRFVIDHLILRYLDSLSEEQTREMVNVLVEQPEPTIFVLALTTDKAKESFDVLRDITGDDGNAAILMGQIASDYAQLMDVASAINIFDAVAQHFDERSAFSMAMVMGKYCSLQATGQDGLTLIGEFVEKAEVRGWHESVASGCASMALNLLFVERDEEARTWLKRMEAVIVQHKDDLRLWQQYPGYLRAALAAQDLPMALRIIDAGLSSKADPKDLAEIWRSMDPIRLEITTGMREIAARGPKRTRSRPGRKKGASSGR